MTKTTRYDFIDAMRGLAVLGVIFHHVAPRIEGLPTVVSRLAGAGGFGVQLFFIVSAATLSLSMDSRFGKEKRRYVCFFVRRFFRIAPLFYAGAVFYTALRYFQGVGGVDAESFLATLLFVHVWWPHAVNLVVPGGWSIGVEMNFYLAAPFLHQRLRSLRTAFTWAFVSLLAGAALSVGLSLAWKRLGEGAALEMGNFFWYWLPMQVPSFLMGFALYILLRFRWSEGPGDPREDRRFSNLLLGVAGYLVVATALSDTRIYLGLAIFTVAFVLLGWGLAVNSTPILVNRLTRSLGVVSYSAYITHFAVLDAAAALWRTPALAAVAKLPPLVQLGLLTAFVLTGTAAASYVTYRLIELPGQRLGRWIVDAIEESAARRAEAPSPFPVGLREDSMSTPDLGAPTA